jgi:hypothetical protein
LSIKRIAPCTPIPVTTSPHYGDFFSSVTLKIFGMVSFTNGKGDGSYEYIEYNRLLFKAIGSSGWIVSETPVSALGKTYSVVWGRFSFTIIFMATFGSNQMRNGPWLLIRPNPSDEQVTTGCFWEARQAV